MNGRQQWRNAIRDSDLDARAKLVALILDTYLDGSGTGWPSRAKLAQGADCSVTSVKRAVHRLEEAELVVVVRSLGRVANRYRATLPNGYTDDPVVVRNGVMGDPSRGSPVPATGPLDGPRTRSTELANEQGGRSRAETDRPAAGAYQPFDARPPDVELDQAALDLAHGWLTTHGVET